MYKKISKILGLLILTIALMRIYHKLNTNKIFESLSNKNNIILMGDSIFKNDPYVEKGESVGDLLQDKQGNSIVVAEDGAVIDDLDYQFSKIPNNLDNKNTKIIVSVGGNDILERYALSDISKTDYVDRIFSKYKGKIDELRDSCHCEFILCNIYYPKSKEYKRYYNLIEKWNDKLERYAKKNKLKVLNIDDTVNKKNHFTNDIEPSAKGSKIITNNILSL